MKGFNIDNMSLKDITEESELIPLMNQEDHDEMEREEIPEELPILPLRNTVLFPGVVIPITANRDNSVKLIRDANKGNKMIGVVTQKDKGVENPAINDLYQVGTVAKIVRVIKMPDGSSMIILQGMRRFAIDQIIKEKPYLVGRISVLQDVLPENNDKEFSAIIDHIRELAVDIINSNPNIPSEATMLIKNIESDKFLINFICSGLNLETDKKQELLENGNLKEKCLETIKYMNQEYQKLELKNNIQSKVRNDLDQQQKEFFLQQQIKTIQEELGEGGSEEDIVQMTQKGKKKKWNKNIKEHFEKELSKFQRMNSQSPEYATQRTYLETFLELPWNKYSNDIIDIKKAQKVLDKEHYGLEEVKKRILEHLAVIKLRKDMKSPILCLYGPPGVGKTSLGKSIAKAIGRKYVRMSLGGLKDESEIRGHRKTYIGAMPGRIVKSIKKAGTSNPLFLLDEIDKLTPSGGYNGDPSSAMLEVLDPQQNSEFYDNFLEIEYDLSKVMFIATANDLSTIQPALRDRMEIINVSGYISEEKVEIAAKHLITRQLVEHAVPTKDFKISKPNIRYIIENYTRESGVRGLEKQLTKCIRNRAKCIAMEEPFDVNLTTEDIVKILGPKKVNLDVYENNDTAGVVTGLAWTSVGGDILFIESILSEGKGNLSITGNLGKVMKESATIAMEYLKANNDQYNIPAEVFKKYNVHIHVPEGATPKDGPSAGITLLTSLVSLFTQQKVKKNIAMTGEITLRGKVLPVGGIKEKILAAKMAKIKEIILCDQNKRDIEEIKEEYLKGLTFHYVSEMKEVIDIAVTSTKAKNAKTL